jgi:type IV pilus assembly protein PilW
MSNKKKQSGLTLVEILIALLIGVVLLAGLMEIFNTTKQSYKLQDGLSRLQENGRFAMDFLAKDIRIAGYYGCNSSVSLQNDDTSTPPKKPNILNSPATFYKNFVIPIQGYEATTALGAAGTPTWAPIGLDSSILNPPDPDLKPVSGSDVLVIRRAEEQSFTVVTHATATDGLTLDGTATTDNLKAAGYLDSTGANECKIAIVNNCAAAAVFQVTSIAGKVLNHQINGCAAKNSTDDPNNSTDNLGNTFKNAQIHQINTVVYYVGNNKAEPPLPCLYRKVGTDAAMELIEGVEEMQILYGEDTNPRDGVPNYYVKADDVTNMANVVSVRLSLTLQTIEDRLAKTPGDGRVRKVFTTTVLLRNRA